MVKGSVNMSELEFEQKVLKKCQEIGLSPSELSSSLLAEIEDQIFEENAN
jgi:hypothetical protein